MPPSFEVLLSEVYSIGWYLHLLYHHLGYGDEQWVCKLEYNIYPRISHLNVEVRAPSPLEALSLALAKAREIDTSVPFRPDYRPVYTPTEPKTPLSDLLANRKPAISLTRRV